MYGSYEKAAVIGCCIVITFLGCHTRRTERMNTECIAIIRTECLPTGWALVPAADMPPIDKTPWWVKNPQLLEGGACKQIDIDGQPTKASRIWAAIYEKQECRVTVFCFVYSTADEASAELRGLTREESSPEDFIGTLKNTVDTVVIMNVPSDCPDRDFFMEHFQGVTEPRVPGP